VKRYSYHYDQYPGAITCAATVGRLGFELDRTNGYLRIDSTKSKAQANGVRFELSSAQVEQTLPSLKVGIPLTMS
jgi:hypothetical protein